MKTNNTGRQERGGHAAAGTVKRLICLALLLSLVLALIPGLSACRQSRKMIMQVGNEAVPYEKMELYLQICLEDYESIAGSQIWDMKIGSDPSYDVACETALSALIRTTVVYNHLRPTQKQITSEENDLIGERAAQLKERITPAQLAALGITDDMLQDYVLQDYCVSKFLSQMSYVVDQDQIDQMVEEHFLWYDQVDVEEYMKCVNLNSIMIYTGQMVNGEWIEYAPEVKVQQHTRAQEALALLKQGESFLYVKDQYNETQPDETAEPFHQGLIESQAAYYFKGQIERDLQEKIFQISEGSISGLLQSEFGYLIVKVNSYPPAGTQEEYEKSLLQQKEAYSKQIMVEQTGNGVEDIISEWLTETSVTVDSLLWNQLKDQFQE